jgi:hypothetical protein
MKYSFVFTFCLLLSFSYLHAQVKKTAYKSSYYVEKVWSKSQNQLLTLETIYRPSQFVFTAEGIYFRKGGSTKWLYNSWTFDKSERTSNGYSMDTYLDEREQKIVINYETSEVWYYHGPDPNTGRYNNLTVYKNCIEDKQLIADAERSRQENNETSGKFRVDMNYVAIYDNESEKWSDWKEGYNTFIINANSNKDIIHIKASGVEVNYRRTSQNVERKYTSEGKGYQIINAIDDDGDRFQFQVFDDIKIGIKMIYGNVMIQFAKF